MNNQRKFETALGNLGYVFDRRNSKGLHFWIHENSGAELKVIPHAPDSRLKSLLNEAKRRAGVPTSDNKRNPAEIRARREAQREAVVRARVRLESLRDTGSRAEVEAAVEAIENEERRFRYWDRLMRSVAS